MCKGGTHLAVIFHFQHSRALLIHFCISSHLSLSLSGKCPFLVPPARTWPPLGCAALVILWSNIGSQLSAAAGPFPYGWECRIRTCQVPLQNQVHCSTSQLLWRLHTEYLSRDSELMSLMPQALMHPPGMLCGQDLLFFSFIYFSLQNLSFGLFQIRMCYLNLPCQSWFSALVEVDVAVCSMRLNEIYICSGMSLETSDVDGSEAVRFKNSKGFIVEMSCERAK